MMLMEEFRSPESYGSLTEAVARGCTRTSEIADNTGIKPSNVSKMMDSLCGLGIVGRRHPVDNPNGKMVRYRWRTTSWRSTTGASSATKV